MEIMHEQNRTLHKRKFRQLPLAKRRKMLRYTRLQILHHRQRELTPNDERSATLTSLDIAGHKAWLETHMWHAKRMKMVDLWGHRLVGFSHAVRRSTLRRGVVDCRHGHRPQRRFDHHIEQLRTASSFTMHRTCILLNSKGNSRHCKSCLVLYAMLPLFPRHQYAFPMVPGFITPICTLAVAGPLMFLDQLQLSGMSRQQAPSPPPLFANYCFSSIPQSSFPLLQRLKLRSSNSRLQHRAMSLPKTAQEKPTFAV